MSSRTKAIVASGAQLSAKLSGACLPVLASLHELDALASKTHRLFVRHSKGVQADRQRRSVDYESGLTLPGLSVNPLNPEPWWTRDRKDWLARQLCRYVHLQDHADEERYAWVLTGEVVGRGPDNEPLLDAIVPLGRLGERLLEEAKARYEEKFDVGRNSTGHDAEK
jgi:Family of unknown function (DUF6098)